MSAWRAGQQAGGITNPAGVVASLRLLLLYDTDYVAILLIILFYTANYVAIPFLTLLHQANVFYSCEIEKYSNLFHWICKTTVFMDSGLLLSLDGMGTQGGCGV